LSSMQVVAVKPSVATSAETTLREMREDAMAKLYLDSNVIVKRYIAERGSESVAEIYQRSDAKEIGICFSMWNIGEAIGVIDQYWRRG
jgi:hypothetical protein